MTKRQTLFSMAMLPALIVLQGCYAGFIPTTNTATDLRTVDFSKLSQMKKGEACNSQFLVFNTGSALVSDAAAAGGIKKINHVEYRYKGNLIMSSFCTIAYGE